MIQPPPHRTPDAPIYRSGRLLGLIIGLLSPGTVVAQSILPTTGANGTGTQVIPSGNQLEIRGGVRSHDNQNLFHSFEQFGLGQGQIANFIATPGLRNILGRVSGGDPSVIDGLIRVTGGQANLYLLNPAGIIFGAQARLDVPATFTATTASGIGFGNGEWFNAVGTNHYASLVGTPDRFAFTALQPGAIANFGHLSVQPGQNLTLLGGTVLNVGTLAAPGGQITLAAVPGHTLVRLSQPDRLLSLEFQPLTTATSPSLPFTPLSLPQLLTGGSLDHASGVSVYPDGTIQLTGSDETIPIVPGTAIAGGQLTVTDTAPTPTPFSIPAINILGTQVGLFGAVLDASGRDGGLVRIGGDERGQGNVPNATFTYVNRDSYIRADSLGQGNGGRVIVWADDSTRVYGSISAQGGSLGGNGGFIETSGKHYLDVAGVTIAAAAPQGKAGMWLLDPRNVTIRDTTSGGTFSNSNPNIFTPTGDSAIVSTADIAAALNNGVSVTIATGTTGSQAGDIVVESPLNVIARNTPTLSLEAANNITVNQTISSTGSLNVSFSAGNQIALNAPVKTDGGNFVSQSNSLSGTNQINTTGSGRVGTLSFNNTTNPTKEGTQQQQVNQAMQPRGQAGEPRPGDRPGQRSSPGQNVNQPGQQQPGQQPLHSGDPRQAEQALKSEFMGHLRMPGGNLAFNMDSQSVLNQVQLATGVRPALVYVRFAPSVVATEASPELAVADVKSTGLPSAMARELNNFDPLSYGQAAAHPDSGLNARSDLIRNPMSAQLEEWIAQDGTEGRSRPDDQLELILITADGVSISQRVAGATRQKVLDVTRYFLNEVADPRKVESQTYLAPAQQLYRWLITPIEPELQARKISNLAFISVTGLRFIPLAALHDGQQFLVQKYSVGLMPSLSLTDTRYVSLKNARVLAAGASTFMEQPPLPAVPTELAVITQQLWQGRSLLNNAFTLENLQAERQRQPFQIVHLATHGEFQSGELENSYIQLWNSKLQLDQLRELGWNNPPVELLVLSACRTALGSDEAELGFAGFALQAGVKSALASLWNISDEGTLAFMTEFYQQLRTAPIKAESLRQTQIAMLKGQVKIQGGQLRSSRGGEISLPPELVTPGDRTLSHPFYWAAFTLIGSPW